MESTKPRVLVLGSTGLTGSAITPTWMTPRIGSRDAQAPQFHHSGLNVDDFAAVYWRAHEQHLPDDSTFFSGSYELPDGSAQLYLRDPAGNLVEVDWPDARTLYARIREELIELRATVHQTGEALRATLYLDRSGITTTAIHP